MKILPPSLESSHQGFLESLRVRSYSVMTVNHYSHTLKNFFGFLVKGGVEDVREVSRRTIGDYQLWLMRRGWSIRTVHSHLVALRRLFEHLEATDAILLNPCQGLRLPKLGDRLPPAALTRGEARAILEAPDVQTRRGLRDRAILELFYSTGIRLEEMAQLTIHDVDTQNGFLRVNKGKFAKDRVVPMGRKACDYVREYLREVRFPWSKLCREERALWLRPGHPPRPLGKAALSLMVRKMGKAALGRSISAHRWRHTCATHLVAEGAGIAHVQRLLGHRCLETTQKYAQVSLPEVKQTFARNHPRARSKARA